MTEIHGSFALERAFEVPWLSPSDRRQPTEGTCDVRRPNISGGFNANNGVAHGYDNYFFADGAFSCTGSTDPARPGNAGGSGGGGRIKMSASGSSSLYGRSSTVQPKSIRILPLIKF